MIDTSRENAEIAALRRWLTDNLGAAPAKQLATCHGLSQACVHGVIQDERRRRHLIEHPLIPGPVAAEPDPLTMGEDPFLAYLRAGRVNPAVDTVNSLARRYGLSEVYVKERLHEQGVAVRPRPRRRAA